jgi:integrase
MDTAAAGGEASLTALVDQAGMPGRSRARAVVVVRRLVSFASGEGIAPLPSQLLDHDVIEAFCVRGCAGRASSTAGTYRSVLEALATSLHGPPPQRGTPFPGARATAPYTAAERAELAAMCAAQRSEARRTSALAMWCCGIGAGLCSGELVALRGSDISCAGSSVVVHVEGPRPRVVPVTERHAAAMVDIARQAGDDVVFRPGGATRHYKNFVNDFARHLMGDPTAPRLTMGRCRASFICDHLAAGTALDDLLFITGLWAVESLARYARHLEGVGHSKADLRARAAAERR